MVYIWFCFLFIGFLHYVLFLLLQTICHLTAILLTMFTFARQTIQKQARNNAREQEVQGVKVHSGGPLVDWNVPDHAYLLAHNLFVLVTHNPNKQRRPQDSTMSYGWIPSSSLVATKYQVTQGTSCNLRSPLTSLTTRGARPLSGRWCRGRGSACPGRWTGTSRDTRSSIIACHW